VVGTTNTQTLTNKSVSGGTNTFTNIPIGAVTNGVDLATAQTLTNKTLTAPVVDTPTLTAATAVGTATVTPLTVTMPASSTAVAVSVVLPAFLPDPVSDAKVQVSARGSVTIKAMNDTAAGPNVPALSVQGGNAAVGFPDIQSWLGHDGTNTTLAKVDYLGNLTATNLPAGVEVFSGTPLIGTYDSTKPIRHYLARKTGTSATTTGYATVTTMPAGVTAILGVTFGMNAVVGHTILYRADASSVTSIVFQVRDAASPYGALGGVAYDFNHDIAYQV